MITTMTTTWHNIHHSIDGSEETREMIEQLHITEEMWFKKYNEKYPHNTQHHSISFLDGQRYCSLTEMPTTDTTQSHTQEWLMMCCDDVMADHTLTQATCCSSLRFVPINLINCSSANFEITSGEHTEYVSMLLQKMEKCYEEFLYFLTKYSRTSHSPRYHSASIHQVCSSNLSC